MRLLQQTALVIYESIRPGILCRQHTALIYAREEMKKPLQEYVLEVYPHLETPGNCSGIELT